MALRGGGAAWALLREVAVALSNGALPGWRSSWFRCRATMGSASGGCVPTEGASASGGPLLLLRACRSERLASPEGDGGASLLSTAETRTLHSLGGRCTEAQWLVEHLDSAAAAPRSVKLPHDGSTSGEEQGMAMAACV